ncbi:hypothetical protein [Roseinatronobacter sp. S2]|uniref:hypothetical protein n=1 Tax=Roseinatronobacter sp. S2 TaxID=3035471 RepID=UPI00240EDE48|nr:hypothetical protein [Roseinatronobacter sp. S2]WFE73640.1 hypothetical protein P8S53_10630 [Roseinatronobacter sp. S2]
MFEWLMIVFGVGPLVLAFFGWAIGLATGIAKQDRSAPSEALLEVSSYKGENESRISTLYEHSCDPETGEFGLKFNRPLK